VRGQLNSILKSPDMTLGMNGIYGQKSMHNRWCRLNALFMMLCLCMNSGFAQQSEDNAAAIRAVIKQDYQLGSIRNERPRHAPIAQAIKDYVAGLDALDLDGVPPDFKTALLRHRDAWFESIEFLRQYSQLRGELHEVFETIHAKDEASHAGLLDVEANIWSTWAEVEVSMQHHGVSINEDE